MISQVQGGTIAQWPTYTRVLLSPSSQV